MTDFAHMCRTLIKVRAVRCSAHKKRRFPAVASEKGFVRMRIGQYNGCHEMIAPLHVPLLIKKMCK